jgi:hypothetical protein
MTRSHKVQAIRQAAKDAQRGDRCARCLGQAPPQDSDAFTDWEALDGGRQVVCPDCVAPSEQQAMDEDAMALAEKVLENRLRRAAERQGYRLSKSRRRDPRAIDYGGYMVIDVQTNGVVAGATPHAYSMDLDGVEEFLTGRGRSRA